MGIEAAIKTTREVLRQNLRIPSYQRPYRWTTTNVMQLLTDIHTSMVSGKREYRIGTVICHRHVEVPKEYFDLIDGQQRLTTILLILRSFSKREEFKQSYEAFRFNGGSRAAILENNDFIKEWLEHSVTGETFFEYVLDKCKFAQIIVDDLGEAFQMFDTQNGRGKSLKPYNLLKAYHIRAMEQNPQDEKIQCDKNWEDATQYDATPSIEGDPNVDILAQLFGEQLFKTRLWCRGEPARTFGRGDIEEFKGFTIDKNHSVDYPYQNPFLLQYLTEKFYRNVLAGTIGTKSRFSTGDTEKNNPFVNINQTILNGHAFFKYIETYVELYKKMFIDLGGFHLAEFKRFFYLYCLTYSAEKNSVWGKACTNPNAFRCPSQAARRVGDTWLRESYKSLCFVLFDKFGEEVFLEYYAKLYRLVYRARVEKKRIEFESAMNDPKKLFVIIHRAKSKADLIELDKLSANLSKTLKTPDEEKDAQKRISTFPFIKTGVRA